jgi:hypothetical protein
MCLHNASRCRLREPGHRRRTRQFRSARRTCPNHQTEGTARYRCSHQCRGGDAQPKRECACPHDRDPLLAEHGPLTVWLEEFRIQPVEDGAVKPDRQELPGPRRWKDRRQRPLTRLRRLHKARARPTLDPVNWSTRTRVVRWWVQTASSDPDLAKHSTQSHPHRHAAVQLRVPTRDHPAPARSQRNC